MSSSTASLPGVALPLKEYSNPVHPNTSTRTWARAREKVLLQVYAGCIDGQEETAKRRIAAALKEDVIARAR